MKKFTVAAALALSLAVSPTVANAGESGSGGAIIIGGAAVMASLLGLGAYLIANKDAPAGSLKAAGPDENMQQFLANAQRNAGTPAYAWTGTLQGPPVAAFAQ